MSRKLASNLIVWVLMPLTLAASVLFIDNAKYMIVSLLVVIYAMVPFFMVFEKRKPKAREIVIIATISAITIVSHLLMRMFGGIQIGTALVIVSGVALGPEAGFLVGSISRFILNFYEGQGPWTPWQMFCWGLLGFLAGMCFNKISKDMLKLGVKTKTEMAKSRTFKAVFGPIVAVIFVEALAYITYLFVPGDDGTFLGWRVYLAGAIGILLGALLQRKRLPCDDITLTVFCFLGTMIIYGGIMNFAMLIYSSGIPGGYDLSFNTIRALYISGFPYDLTHAVLASICMFIVGNPMIRKIERVKIKYGIYM
ncbi:MAG: ECF transporter S component [Clostridia bacterium]|nr:ECF transporter S component [Clostridia bacterium]